MIQALIDRGVQIPAPGAVVIEDIDPERIEAGVTLYPGVTLCGRETMIGRGSRIGKAGGGYFENVRCGRGVDLFGGYFSDAVFLNGVVIRGHSEIRGGTLMEEGAECGHHVGYKMTIMMPFVVSGSLINFCDALFAGGTSRKDHSEIGSCLALYNYTPWSDKYASLFGDVPAGVFLRQPRIFVGGQTQIVSPVKVGYGTVIAAGSAVRRNVPPGVLYGETSQALNQPFDPEMLGALRPKVALTAEYIANLWCLRIWYREIRLPLVDDDFTTELYRAAMLQIEAGIQERLKRLDNIVAKLERSSELHHQIADKTHDGKHKTRHELRAREHRALLTGWPELRAVLEREPELEDGEALAAIREHMLGVSGSYVERVQSLPDALVERGYRSLKSGVDALIDAFL